MHDDHKYSANESDVSLECDTVSVASHIAAIESDVLLVELDTEERTKIVTYNESTTFESDAVSVASHIAAIESDVLLVELDTKETNEIVTYNESTTFESDVDETAESNRALRRWRRRVRTLFKVFTFCVQKPHD